jgi:hypothetical protein
MDHATTTDRHGGWSPRCAGAGGAARSALVTIGLSLLAGGLIIASSLIIKQEPSSEIVKVFAAALPIPAFIAMFWVLVRATRRLDEMLIRMQLEALAATVIAVSTLVVAYGQFERIGYLPPAGLWLAWPIIAFTYPVCYLFALRRYR